MIYLDMNYFLRAIVAACAAFAAVPVEAQHRLITQGNDRLVIVDRDGKLEWQMPWGGIHDLHVLPSGNIMVQQGASKVVEIDLDRHEVVWTYDSATANGNAGRPVEVHAFQPLADGRVMIAESGPARIIEVDRAGKILHTVKLKVDHPHPHTDTRLARKLDERAIISSVTKGTASCASTIQAGSVVWEYAVPLFGKEPKPGHGPEAFGNKCFCRRATARGNTLVTTGNGHSVIEVTPEQGDRRGKSTKRIWRASCWRG